ncbi:MAG: DUF4920 domain-containing protein [Candidatus Eisenbacteria bacterium]|nr:DUF4920 domain-containing protein [Candidatus Latescibacterota bacterium]MBD3301327.1 DUF4920 domain-containing protein [Candidatus Eisenbacteria bacterium]
MLWRTLFVFALILCLAGGLGCSKSRTEGTPALTVGSPITLEEAVSISDLAARTEAYVDQAVLLEGTVVGICQGSGCWAEVADEDGATFLARSLDHSVLLPTDCMGRRVAIQGTVTVLEPVEAPEETAAHEHEHEHAGEHAEGEEAHVCPRPQYVVSTAGAALY